MKKCEICGIDETETRIIVSKFGTLCRKHYLRKYKNKRVDRSIYDPNTFIIHDDYAEIIIYDKECNECARALIDLEDVDKCKKRKWHIKHSRNTDYAISKGVFLHRYVLNYYGDLDIDHDNHNGLDNRKSNLIIRTHAKNITNQYKEDTGIKLVPSGNYQASIAKDNKTIYLGTYTNKQDAIQARKEAEELYFPF